MSPDLLRLVPAICQIFTDIGYVANVTEIEGQISITVSKGDYSEAKLFPFPSVNRDLSIPLRAWRAALVTQDQTP